MNKKYKSHNNEITNNDKIGNLVCKIYFFLILIFLPLYMNKAFYTAMINAKAQAYWLLSGIVMLGIISYFIQGSVSKEYKWKFSLKRWNLIDFSILLFAVVVSISFFLSDNLKNCFWGNDGFYVGTYMVVSSIVFYFFLSRKLIPSQAMWEMVFIVSDLIFVWIFLNTISIDILNMHAPILETQYFAYFASLGQMDSVSAYLCLLLPIGILFFVNETKKSDSIFYGVFCLLALLAVFCIQTDGIFIGLAFCGIFLFPYIFSDRDKIEKLLYVGIMAGADLLILKLLFLLISERIKNDAGISNYMIQHWVGILLIVACVLLLILFKKFYTRIQKRFLKGLSIASSLGVIAIILGYVCYSAVHFNPDWGNGRGSIWLGSLHLFQEYSIQEKLFGLGTEMIKQPLTQAAGWNINLANSHNNILECLLSLGIFGLIAYLLVWTAIVLPFFRKDRAGWSTERVAYFMALIAYFGQSIVGNPYSLTVPILFLILALYRNQEWREKISKSH